MTSLHPEPDRSTDELGPQGFDRLAVRQALAQVNRCHPGDTLILARFAYSAEHGLGPGSDVHAAWLAGLDADGVDFVAETPHGPVVLRLAFEWPASTLAAAGHQLVVLYRAGCRAASEG